MWYLASLLADALLGSSRRAGMRKEELAMTTSHFESFRSVPNRAGRLLFAGPNISLFSRLAGLLTADSYSTHAARPVLLLCFFSTRPQKGTPDDWVPRHPELVRLTGRHPFNVEPPVWRIKDHGFISPNELHYVRNHGAVPRITDGDAHKVGAVGACCLRRENSSYLGFCGIHVCAMLVVPVV